MKPPGTRWDLGCRCEFGPQAGALAPRIVGGMSGTGAAVHDQPRSRDTVLEELALTIEECPGVVKRERYHGPPAIPRRLQRHIAADRQRRPGPPREITQQGSGHADRPLSWRRGSWNCRRVAYGLLGVGPDGCGDGADGCGGAPDGFGVAPDGWGGAAPRLANSRRFSGGSCWYSSHFCWTCWRWSGGSCLLVLYCCRA